MYVELRRQNPAHFTANQFRRRRIQKIEAAPLFNIVRRCAGIRLHQHAIFPPGNLPSRVSGQLSRCLNPTDYSHFRESVRTGFYWRSSAPCACSVLGIITHLHPDCSWSEHPVANTATNPTDNNKAFIVFIFISYLSCNNNLTLFSSLSKFEELSVAQMSHYTNWKPLSARFQFPEPCTRGPALASLVTGFIGTI